jgi:CBS domain-containing protein
LEFDVMRVETLMPVACKRLVIIREDAPLTDAAKLLLEADANTDCPILVACNADERMAGVISKTDVVRQISRCPESKLKTAVATVMTRTVVSCRAGDLLHEVWTTMKDRKLKNVPILDQDSRPIGVLNARDLFEALLEEVEHEEVLLRDYVMGIGHPRV